MEPQRADCVAGHVGLELRNVGKNYPFERSRRFPGILANSSHRDYSLLSCGGGDTQLGPSARILGGMLALAGIAAMFCRCQDDPAATNPAIAHFALDLSEPGANGHSGRHHDRTGRSGLPANLDVER